MAGDTAADIIEQFRASWDTLRRYPILVVPQIVAQAAVFGLTLVLVGAAATAFMVGGVAGGVVGLVLGGLLFALVVGLVSLVVSAVVIVMAKDALAGRDPSMGDALGAVMGRLGDVVIASVLAMVAVGIGMLLLVLPGLVAAFFLVFTLPAVLLDGDGAIDAIRRSIAVVKDNLGAAAGLVVGWIVVTVIVAIASKILAFVPVIGWLASGVLFGAAVAYMSLVAVRVYQALPRR
jgi:hypothetical protein